MRRFFLLGFFVCILASIIYAEGSSELFRLKIENRISGEVAVSHDQGKDWEHLGSVLAPAWQNDERGYSAVRWIEGSRIAGTSINALHIKIGPRNKYGPIFSILPSEQFDNQLKLHSYFHDSSSIYTDIPAGSDIFGGKFTPPVGAQVLFVTAAKPVAKLYNDYVPKIDDVYYIIVERTPELPTEIIFENRFGGKVTANYLGGYSKVIGQVLRPVVGVGRFEGARFTGPGRIRANHPGVIDVSTSPVGEIGGFQIVPARHADSIGHIKERTQWLVVGPTEVGGTPLEGQSPLFRDYIRPVYGPNDIFADDYYEKFLERFLVQVTYQGDDRWQPMPILEIPSFYLGKDLPAWTLRALSRVDKIKIVFPMPNQL